MQDRCARHFEEYKRQSECSIEGCHEPVVGRGWCRIHWDHWNRNGGPLNRLRVAPGEPLAWLLRMMEEDRADDRCREWPYARNDSGYGVMNRHDGTGLVTRAMWVVMELDGRPRLEGTWPSGRSRWEVCHSCDNPPCCWPTHLRWGTRQDNSDDMVARGRRSWDDVRGENNSHAKLTEVEVRTIRQIAHYDTAAAIARYFGVSHSTIAAIIQRRTWKHVP